MSVLDYAIRIIKATMKNHSNESFFPYYYNKFWLEAQHPAGLPFQLMPKLQ